MLDETTFLEGEEQQDEFAGQKTDLKEVLRQLLLEHAQRRHELSLKFQRAAAEASGFTQAAPWRRASR